MPATLNYRDPIGVVPPLFAAAAVMHDVKRAKAATFHPERAPVELPPAEAAHRATLFAQARKGNAVAIRALAREYHLRLVPVGA